VPPSILASHSIPAAHASTLARLEKRMEELERHCEQALGVLRVSVEPSQTSDVAFVRMCPQARFLQQSLRR